jgi:hypothetical protein
MKDYLEGQTALQGYKIQSLRNENLKIESRKEDLRNQVVGCVIFAIIPLTFVLLHHLSVLLLPIWLACIFVDYSTFFNFFWHLCSLGGCKEQRKN